MHQNANQIRGMTITESHIIPPGTRSDGCIRQKGGPHWPDVPDVGTACSYCTTAWRYRVARQKLNRTLELGHVRPPLTTTQPSQGMGRGTHDESSAVIVHPTQVPREMTCGSNATSSLTTFELVCQHLR